MDKTAGCPLSMQRASVYVGKGKDQMILLGSWSLGRGTLCNKGKWEEMAKGGNGLSDLGEQREEDHWAWLLRSDPSSSVGSGQDLEQRRRRGEDGSPRLQLQKGIGGEREIPIA